MPQMKTSGGRVARPVQISQEGTFDRLRNEVSRLFDDFSLARETRSFLGWPDEVDLMVPPLELVEKKDGYQLSVDVPGLDRKDLSIELIGSCLRISGERTHSEDRQTNGYLINERSYGSMRRDVDLPADVRLDSIKATMQNGVLDIEMKKDPGAGAHSRKILID